MKTGVVTGSTRGIGYGMAEAFLARGCNVVVSGRSAASVERAVQALSARHGSERLLGQACAVDSYEQVRALWDAAAARFGRVDVWVNNAGLGNPMHPFWEQTPALIHDVVNTNLTGLMYGAKVAIEGMLRQGGGQVYNMEGSGSDGSIRRGLALYGTTKAAVRHVTRALIAETRGTPVQVCYLSPGIVITDLLTGGYVGTDANVPRMKRIFNILGDKVETVSPYLVDRILANDKHGARVAWLTTPKILWRFLTASFNRRNLFSEEA